VRVAGPRAELRTVAEGTPPDLDRADIFAAALACALAALERLEARRAKGAAKGAR
jgi:hypothetical protein